MLPGPATEDGMRSASVRPDARRLPRTAAPGTRAHVRPGAGHAADVEEPVSRTGTRISRLADEKPPHRSEKETGVPHD